MKHSKPFARILSLSCGLLLAALLPQGAQSQTVQFESASDLTSFNQVTAADAASTDFNHAATGGVNGSGGLVHALSGAVDTTAIYTPTSFDLSTLSSLTVSIDFLTGAGAPFTGSANAVAMVGLVGNTTTGFYSVNNAVTGDNFVGGRIRNVSSGSGGMDGLQSQTKMLNTAATSGPADASVANIVFLPNEWYRLSMNVVRTATANTFSYSLMVEDIGATGTSTPTTPANGTLAGSLVNADLYNDSAVYAAFRGVPTVSGWDVAFDNFTVTTTPVPEPTVMALAALGGLGLLFGRKQRQ